MVNDLKLIKKHYGEKMMHLCRTLFPTLLEEPGKLYNLLDSCFNHNHHLYEDLIEQKKVMDFKDYIYAKEANKKKNNFSTNKTPQELLQSVGYKLYECITKEELEKYKIYYRKDELLCTFNENRLSRCYIFFAIKDNALELNRDDYDNPERQDEYGTSVLSIQFDKGNTNFLSIKNRYNDTVINPDATFSNNLDSIVKGLTESFKKKYNLNIECNEDYFDLDNYVKADDGKFYKYNYEINDVYYCPNNIIIDNGDVITEYYEKEKYIIMDYFIIDLQNKRIKLYDNSINDSFIKCFKNIIKIDVINNKEHNTKKIKILTDKGEYLIELDKHNRMISYIDNNTTITSDHFLEENIYLEKLEMNKLKKVGNNTLKINTKLEELTAPEVKMIGNYVLQNNLKLEKLSLPKAKYIGNNFLLYNSLIKQVYLPNVKEVGNKFLVRASELLDLDMPELTICGNHFLEVAANLKTLNLQNVQVIGDSFLEENLRLEKLYLPNIIKVGSNFLYNNNAIKEIICPKLEYVKDNFLSMAKNLRKAILPSLAYIKDNFMMYSTMEEIDLPQVEYIADSFMEYNKYLKRFNAPELKEIGNCFLENNEELVELNTPSLIKVKDSFLCNIQRLRKLILTSLEEAGDKFCINNLSIEEIILSKLKKVGSCFLRNNNKIKVLNLPNLIEVGYLFFANNHSVRIISAPKLINIGDYFMCENINLEQININNQATCTYDFLYNYFLTHVSGKEDEITYENSR